jgi:hypothetical protein
MATVRFRLAAASANAFQDLRFTNLERGGIINMWGSTATAGEVLTVGGGVDSVIAQNVQINPELVAQKIAVSDDQIIFSEPVQPGQLRCEVPVNAAGMNIMLHVQAA